LKLRAAWAKGIHSEQGEVAVIDVTRELIKRFPPGKDVVDAPRLWSRKIGLKATAGIEATFEAGVEEELGDGKKRTAGFKTGPELLCCFLPHKIAFGETNPPNNERLRGPH
jgi:hypothetical protein